MLPRADSGQPDSSPDPSSPDPSRLGPTRRARVRIGIGAAVVLVLGAFAVAVVVGLLTPGGATAVISASARPRTTRSASVSQATDPDPSPTASTTVVYVQLVGAVAHPGLYRLPSGSRLVDAIAAAGGFSSDADPASVNLARPLVDGEQIVVSTPGAPAPASASTPATGAPAAKVDLNTADATALETLPRIGPAMAQRILAWRAKNGRFRSAEDLLDVAGIGDATFAGLKDLVTV